MTPDATQRLLEAIDSLRRSRRYTELVRDDLNEAQERHARAVKTEEDAAQALLDAIDAWQANLP